MSSPLPTNDQDREKFKLDILKLVHERNLGRVDFVEEKSCGKIHWKERKIHEIIDTLTKGDHLIVPELSRLGRYMLEIMEILSIGNILFSQHTFKCNGFDINGEEYLGHDYSIQAEKSIYLLVWIPILFSI